MPHPLPRPLTTYFLSHWAQQVIEGTPAHGWSSKELAKYVEWVLVQCSSHFTVCPVEEDLAHSGPSAQPAVSHCRNGTQAQHGVCTGVQAGNSVHHSMNWSPTHTPLAEVHNESWSSTNLILDEELLCDELNEEVQFQVISVIAG